MTRHVRARFRCCARSPGGRRRSRCLYRSGRACSGGCVTNGDFGRVRPELTARQHARLGRPRRRRRDSAVPPSEFRTTDEERELRDRAYALIEPPYNRSRWDSVWREYGLGRTIAREPQPFDRTDLSRQAASRPIAARRRRPMRRSSPTPATTSSGCQPFFTVAGRVYRHGPAAHAEPRARVGPQPARTLQCASPATARTRAIVAWVCRALKERIASYRFALERLVIAVPSAGAAEADRAIDAAGRRGPASIAGCAAARSRREG